MSRAYFTWQEAVLCSKLEPTTRLVCHTIGCHMAMDGTGCFPSYGLIADESGLNRATVIRHVAKAVEAGYLEVTGRLDKEGDQTSNLYRPIMPGVVAQRDHGSRTQSPRVVAQRDPNYSSELPIEQTVRACRFEEFWSAYPNKVGKRVCEHKWKTLGLDKHFEAVLAGVKRWKASDRWARGFIADPLTFLNQERWKDIPPASEKLKGVMRVRESTPAEKDDARFNQEMIRQRKLPGNLRKSDDEIAKLAHDALYVK